MSVNTVEVVERAWIDTLPFPCCPVSHGYWWNKTQMEKKRKYSKESQPIELVNFVDNEMTLVSCLLYSRDVVSHYVKRALRYSKNSERKRFNAIATVTDNSWHILQEKSNKVASKIKVYSVRDDNHDIENCTYYLQKTMEV